MAVLGKPPEDLEIASKILMREQIEGILTLLVAAAFIAFFPRSTERPVSLLGIRYFSESQAMILNARVVRDDPSKVHAHVHVKKSEMKDAVSQPCEPGNAWRADMSSLSSQTGVL